MKKILILFSIVIIALPAYAGIGISLWGGYTSVDMEDMNNHLEEKESDIKGYGLTPTVDTYKHAGFAVLDVDFKILPAVKAGVRGGFVICAPASVEVTGDLTSIDSSYDTGTLAYNMNGVLLPLMGGVKVVLGAPLAPFELTASVHAGYGLYFITRGISLDSDVGGKVRADIPYIGEGFVGEATAGVTAGIVPLIDIVAYGGYRIANAPYVKADASIVESELEIDVPEGETLKDSEGNDIRVNMSGFTAGAGLRIRF